MSLKQGIYKAANHQFCSRKFVCGR